jgi:Icc-related predicted phosphoesterase
VWQAFSRQCRWVTGVAGNHDVFGSNGPSVPDFKEFCRQPKTHFLDGHVVDLDGLKIAGLSGIVGNPNRPYRRLEPDYVDAVLTLCEAAPHMLVLHDGPDFPSLGFKGNPVIREALEISHPTLVIRGHAHWEKSLVTLSNGTQVLNVDARAILVGRNGSLGS